MKSQTTRRAALTTAGLGALAASLSPSVNAADISPVEKANVQVIKDFSAAWSSHNPTKIMSFFADNCAYRMTETREPIKGLEAVKDRINSLAGTVEGFELLDTWARGPMVVNERIDHFTSGGLKSWHGVGVFFLKDGKIVEWYDYTISTERR